MRKETLPIRINLISSSHLLREGLVTLLKDHIPVHFEAHYTVSFPIDQYISDSDRHVVLIDSGLGQDAAIAWIRFCRRNAPKTQIIILDLTDEINIILACVEAGANGFTLRGANVKEVAETICLALNGEAQCSQEIIHQMFSRLSELTDNHDSVYRVNPLTPRELEVLSCIANGLSNKEIGLKLCIELRTVKHHVHNILNKLDVKRRWQAANLAREEGWLE